MENSPATDTPTTQQLTEQRVAGHTVPLGTELAFQCFWGWTNHPDEAATRKAWDNIDIMSRSAWERVARMAFDYIRAADHAD